MTRIDMTFKEKVDIEAELRECQRRLAEELALREEADQRADMADKFGFVMAFLCCFLFCLMLYLGL